MPKLAVFGGTGIIGRSIIEHLDTQNNWQGLCIARRNQQISEQTPFVELNLLEPKLSDATKALFSDVTHAVYAAYLALKPMGFTLVRSRLLQKKPIRVTCHPTFTTTRKTFSK